LGGSPGLLELPELMGFDIQIGTTEKVKPTAVQLVSAIEIR
jgi:hypothetical protein